MIKVISNIGCKRCLKVKSRLDKEGIDFSFRYIDELSDDLADKYTEMAREKGQQFFPIVVKDDELVNLVFENNKLIKIGDII